MFEWIGAMMGSSWLAQWAPSDALRSHFPPRHSDFRDALPDELPDVVAAYAPYVHHGRWTLGLCDMWSPKAKMVKHSVHIPCWDSFHLNPLRWRGACLGRNLHECFWVGMRQTRWTRAAYAGALGREYVMPVQGVGRHGFKSDLKALCFLYCFLSCCFSCGLGQVITVCGNVAVNCGACYSCHGREKLRRRYALPPTFGLPPGVDDCCVHFVCFYCASHQELRELAIRGVDGPGMHVLDVTPQSFKNVPGFEAALAKRQAVVAEMTSHPPTMFKSRPPKPVLEVVQQGVAAAAGIKEENGLAPAESVGEALGWRQYKAPAAQEMSRGGGGPAGLPLRRTRSAERADIEAAALAGAAENGDLEVSPRAWSVAY